MFARTSSLTRRTTVSTVPIRHAGTSTTPNNRTEKKDVNNNSRIIVTGATGHLGKMVIENLVGLVPREKIVACVRDVSKASNFWEGVEVRVGDFADPDSLVKAFIGADQLLIVSVPKLGDEAAQLHRAAIKAAQEAGVGRILYTSHSGAKTGSPFLPADQHASTEAELAKSGLPYTSLRHGFYAESCLHMIGDGLRSGELRTPEDGPVAWTTRADLARADAAILASGGQWDGITPLTAKEAITMAELAVIASEVMGREVRHVTVTDEEWRDAKIAAGMPAMYADLLLGTFRASRRGDFASTDPSLERLLGHAPLTMRDVLKTVDNKN